MTTDTGSRATTTMQELLRKEQEIARFAEINIAQQRALADAKSAAVGSGGEAVSINAFGRYDTHSSKHPQRDCLVVSDVVSDVGVFHPGSEFEMRDAAKEQRELSQIGDAALLAS